VTGKRDILRWGACFVLVLCFHAAGAMALLARWNANDDLVANAPVITIELAPLPVAPETKPSEAPPGPQQSEAEPPPEPEPVKPVEKAELEALPEPKTKAKPEPKPEKPLAKLELPTDLAVTPPPRPKEKEKAQEKKKPHHRRASLESAPSAAERKAERAAAPAPGAASHNPRAVPSWKSALVAQLERSKRYPAEARARGEQGTAELAFSVDRRGGVHHARIIRSSGSPLLDRETLAMIERAAPLPPPPPEMSGAQISIAVPIRYNIR